MPLPIDDSWPEYWSAVRSGVAAVGSTLDAYMALDRDHVVDRFVRHWDLLEPLVDDPALDHIRFATFDGDPLAYRFRVIATQLGGTIRLVDFDVI